MTKSRRTDRDSRPPSDDDSEESDGKDKDVDATSSRRAVPVAASS